MKADKGSIKYQLNEIGITVTEKNDKNYPDNNHYNRMLLDEKGNEIGYFVPNKIKEKYNIKPI